MPSERELGYIAATIDCEGYIAISKTKARRSGRSGHWGLRVTVSQADIRLGKWLQSVVGGQLYGPYQTKVKGTDPNRAPYGRPWWSWETHSDAASAMLQAILPYLVLKRDQAELAIAFQSTISKKNGGHKLAPHVEIQREEMRDNLLRIRAVGGE